MYSIVSLLFQCFLDVIAELEKLDMVSSDSVNLVEECLSEIGRMDLAKKVTAYKMSGENVFHFKLLFPNLYRKKGTEVFSKSTCHSLLRSRRVNTPPPSFFKR